MSAKPIRPGEVLRDRVLPKYNLTQDQFAELIGVSRFSVNQLINGKRNMTAAMALRIGHVTGTTAHFWLNMQQRVDIYEALLRHGDEVSKLPALATEIHIKDLPWGCSR